MMDSKDFNFALEHESRHILYGLYIDIGGEIDTDRDIKSALKEKLTALESELLQSIYEETNGDGKRKYSNESLRQAEFNKRKAEDKEINTIIKNINGIEADIRKKERMLKLIEYELKARIASPEVF